VRDLSAFAQGQEIPALQRNIACCAASGMTGPGDRTRGHLALVAPGLLRREGAQDGGLGGGGREGGVLGEGSRMGAIRPVGCAFVAPAERIEAGGWCAGCAPGAVDRWVRVGWSVGWVVSTHRLRATSKTVGSENPPYGLRVDRRSNCGCVNQAGRDRMARFTGSRWGRR